MAIDVTVPGSPGWWMQQLYQRIQKRNRDRLNRLWSYAEGKPPILFATENTASAFWKFQASSRTNFAELICLAPVDKTHVRTIRTGADGDESGDPAAMAIWDANGLEAQQTQVYMWRKIFSVAYVSVGMDDGDEYPTICPEDPRQTITVQHPTKPWEAVAGLKMWHDEVDQTDYIALYLLGKKYIAYAPRSGSKKAQKFSPSGYTLAPTVLPEDGSYTGPLSEEYDEAIGVPLVCFENRFGVGEFEKHTDLLDRINHMVLQRLVIATMQAFRQRALELTEDLPKTDPDTGLDINYDEVFSADPGALWKLPQGAKIWESAQADLSGILQGVKDDILNLSAVTRTPLVMFTPDAATQTAEGADLQVDGLTSKVQFDQRADGRSWALVFSKAFLLKGDTKRADLGALKVDWNPAKQHSLSEMANADAVSHLPFEDKLRVIWQMTPREIAAAKTNRADDLAFQALLTAATTPPPAPTQLTAEPAGGQQGGSGARAIGAGPASGTGAGNGGQ